MRVRRQRPGIRSNVASVKENFFVLRERPIYYAPQRVRPLVRPLARPLVRPLVIPLVYQQQGLNPATKQLLRWIAIMVIITVSFWCFGFGYTN